MSADEPKKQSVKNNDGFQHAPKRASCSFHMDPKSRHEASTTNLYDALNMINNDDVLGEKGENTIHVDKVDNSTPNVDIGLLGAKGEEAGSKMGKNKEGDLADRESESDVEDNETTCFMTSKISKRISSSKSVGGTRRKSLSEP
uniref:Uncharacterized protein n=1 Tax=Tanacetum cinerariifolium TaxID=118510 RepID=A0A699HKX8_TANCI|nr:hypothetical protein [Tanacetum cinerariifolium]